MTINSYKLINLWPSKLETKHDEWKKEVFQTPVDRKADQN